ncbi:hypothetical protein RUM44_001398 [Polyplax serrata]|uniref:Protein O-mannosyl-transferase 2 n=1 Tax=Polyplax serrata TaxID=468196 RepID=A0ABR1AJZ2_POLSC
MGHKPKREEASIKTDQDWWWFFIVIITLTVLTRFYKVTEPDHVCWDETHFGKMGSWYINRTFFFDVHPPLGKMLIALSGYLSGYDGTFPFEKPGDKYDNINYVGMRVFCTFMGASIVPFAFVTVWELTKSKMSAFLGASFILLDVGMITLNQYILLDPILLFFVSGSVMGMVKVKANQHNSFTSQWWLWLIFTGVMLAGAISVKFVGLFAIILVGLYTIVELWEILGDLSEPVMVTIKHFLARALCLILLPAVLYISYFYVHLAILNRSGNGDGFYSSAFQSKLIGNSLYNTSMPMEVAYGAVITLKNHRTGGGYLHSHWHLYPEGVGARQQQITTYTHKDDNNKWLIKPYNKDKADEDIKFVRNGDLIRLEHITTGRNLHSHKEQAPLTKKHLQVTGYGENGTGDANDIWKLIIDGSDEPISVKTVTTKIKLIHYLQHCILTTTSKQLPKWAYEQQEVACNPNIRDGNAVWNVEDNFFPKLPNVSFEMYAPGFLERFFESHAVMLQGNAGLKPKEGEVTSRPWQWPLNYRGQFFSGNNYKIYLLGNPVIWWGNLFLLPCSLLLLLYNAILQKRGTTESKQIISQRNRVAESCLWLFIGWFVHYVPFWAMGRVLYFHHYFPAAYFSSMLSGVIVNYLLQVLPRIFPEKWSTVFYHWSLGFLFSGVYYSFYLFSPLAYGMVTQGNETYIEMQHLRWLDSWEF